MTQSKTAPGTASSETVEPGNATSRSCSSTSRPTTTHQPLPSLSASGGQLDVRAEGANSLYALGIQAQDIATEITLAAELLATDDPEQEASAVALIGQYLEAQAHTSELVAAKADNICRYIDHLKAKAQFRRDQADRLEQLSYDDFRRADSLERYMLDILTKLFPGQRQFSLPTHELRSRKTTAVAIDNEMDIPAALTRTRTTVQPDKAAIKAAIKRGENVPGARLEERTSWTIK